MTILPPSVPLEVLASGHNILCFCLIPSVNKVFFLIGFYGDRLVCLSLPSPESVRNISKSSWILVLSWDVDFLRCHFNMLFRSWPSRFDVCSDTFQFYQPCFEVSNLIFSRSALHTTECPYLLAGGMFQMVNKCWGEFLIKVWPSSSRISFKLLDS